MYYFISPLAIYDSSGCSTSLVIICCQSFELLLFWWVRCCMYPMLDILLLSYRSLRLFPPIVWIKSFLLLYPQIPSFLCHLHSTIESSHWVIHFSYCVFQHSSNFFFLLRHFIFPFVYIACWHILVRATYSLIIIPTSCHLAVGTCWLSFTMEVKIFLFHCMVSNFGTVFWTFWILCYDTLSLI